MPSDPTKNPSRSPDHPLKGEKELEQAGIENARMEALWLFRASGGNSEIFRKHIDERKTGRPLAYILGTQDFEGREFLVNESVLIPRQDTGVLVRSALAHIHKQNKKIKVLDLGTGSGIIAVTLALESPDASVTAADKSAQAIETARANAERLGASGKITFIESDLFGSLTEKFDMIVSNPPYIKTEAIPSLQREIQFEPRLALDGGTDGTDLIRKILQGAPSFLNAGGILMMEVGYDQSKKVLEMMKDRPYKNLAVYKDDSGIERVVSGEI